MVFGSPQVMPQEAFCREIPRRCQKVKDCASYATAHQVCERIHQYMSFNEAKNSYNSEMDGTALCNRED